MAGKAMEYKILVNADGTFQGDVICRGDRKCDEFVHVMSQFADVKSVKDKPDTQPNFNELSQQ